MRYSELLEGDVIIMTDWPDDEERSAPWLLVKHVDDRTRWLNLMTCQQTWTPKSITQIHPGCLVIRRGQELARSPQADEEGT